ncbi:hypothetical protein C0J52_23033 [Blattella germanica]|nr:hypothetical protein C0J52_23033 [Blattella germanica]
MAEVASLRSENIQLRLIAEEAKDANATAEAAMQSLEEKYTEMQSRLIKGTEEQMMEQEQQLTVARQRFREVQDELDDLRTLTNDQTVQLEEYRNKYLQAQEQVEELKKNIELLEMDNSHIIEQVNIELQRIKTQFQERMNELTPLPDILTATQLKLKESQQLKAIVEHNLEEMSQELQEAKEQIDALQREMVNSQTSIQIGSDEKDALKAAIENWEKKYNDLKEESSALKSNIVRLEEAAIQNQIRFQEKVHEITQLTVQLETVREESARQIRQRMQFQINNLTDNFDQAQLRIQNLQSHVNFLKTSYHDFYGPDLI